MIITQVEFNILMVKTKVTKMYIYIYFLLIFNTIYHTSFGFNYKLLMLSMYNTSKKLYYKTLSFGHYLVR